jgi:hypothetical protein
MKRLYLSSLFILLLVAVRADEIDSIAWLIKQGNTQRLSELMASTVELTMNGEETTYSKKQASEMVTKFFNEHRPVSSQLLHKVNTGHKFLFGVVIYNSSNGEYRIAYTLDVSNGPARIIELRFEPEKTK